MTADTTQSEALTDSEGASFLHFVTSSHFKNIAKILLDGPVPLAVSSMNFFSPAVSPILQ